MIGHAIFIALICAAHCAYAATRTSGENRLWTMRGEGNPVCAEIRASLESVSPEEFWNGKWSRAFESVDWQHGSFVVVTTSGTTESVPLKYVETDMDADGTSEVVVVTENMMRSVLFDWLYLLDAAAFRIAHESGRLSAALEEAMQLNSSNYVTFSDGEIAVPVQLQIWKQQRESYLLLKEQNFARPNASIANTLLVAAIPKASAPAPTTLTERKMLRPTMVCRFAREAKNPLQPIAPKSDLRHPQSLPMTITRTNE
jgi:hypothetical protein